MLTNNLKVLLNFHSIPKEADADLKEFFQRVFQKKYENRVNCAECLDLDFFKKHNIPRRMYLVEDSTRIIDGINI